MPPTIVGTGAVSPSAASITPAFPGSLAVDDVIVGIGETIGGVTFPTLATNGFAHISSDGTPVSPVVQGVNTSLHVVWRRYDGVVTAHAWGDSGDHNQGRYIAIRGCPTTGNPWHIVSVASSATSSTALSWPGVTTTVPDTLILEIASTSADIGTAQITTITNGNYTSITEQMDNATALGNGGVLICYSATFAGQGATGASTGTVVTAGTKAYMTLALAAAAGSGGVAPQTLQRSHRPREEHQVAGPYAQPHISSQIRDGGTA
jgi:hypothetical protein